MEIQHAADDAAPLAVYYTTDRAGYRLPNKLLTEVPRGQAAAYSGALRNRIVNFRDFMSRYRSAITVERTERRNNPNYIGDRAVTAISHALTTFLGGFENLRVQEEPLRLLVDKDGETLDLSQLSDGERSFLAMICDLGRRLALANPRLSNPLHGPGVVLIDELELHLHPKWQRQIIHNMTTTFPHCQFIATTHSPQVVASRRARSGSPFGFCWNHPSGPQPWDGFKLDSTPSHGGRRPTRASDGSHSIC